MPQLALDPKSLELRHAPVVTQINTGKSILRRAKPADLDAITELGVEALNIDPFEDMVIDPGRCRRMAQMCVNDAGSFAWVSEIDRVVVAAVLASVHDCMCYERKQASVVQFYTRVPGEGIKLIRHFFRWVEPRRAIKMVAFTLETKVDPRIGKMLSRMGLNLEMPVYLMTRGSK